jgi:hypothetical protein
MWCGLDCARLISSVKGKADTTDSVIYSGDGIGGTVLRCSDPCRRSTDGGISADRDVA